MIAVSVLFSDPEDPRRTATCEMPDYFTDLNLDQIVDPIAAKIEEYDLKRVFYRTLSKVDEIEYRQEIMRDLESPDLRSSVLRFSDQIRAMRRNLAMIEKLYNANNKKGWFLEAASIYCDAASGLARSLAGSKIEAVGLKAFKAYLSGYIASDQFLELVSELKALKDDLAAVQYCITIKDLTVRVRKYEGESDYSAEIESIFSRFRQGESKSYLQKYSPSLGMDHVEGNILDCVAKLFPEQFSRLDDFCSAHTDFLDATIDTFEREIQFYLSYLEYIDTLKKSSMDFCYPIISSADKQLEFKGLFDLALAKKVSLTGNPVVVNDGMLHGKERIFVVTGPNQGGKTTFARAFGQLNHLAGLGCPVPGSSARLFLFDTILTHFEREETIQSQRGKLQEELVRIHESLERASTRSLLILNEVFTSTTLKDSLFLSRAILGKIIALDAICVCVTFLDELASMDEKVVSLVGGVDPTDPTIRTFKMERRSADGLAYAVSIAEKYDLTYKRLKDRIRV